MTIRQEHKQFTRSRILDAAAAELGRNSVEELTVNRVARTAGITERTLYRHFPTRDDLLGAVWAHIQGRIGSQGFPSTADELCKWPAHLFAAFDNHAELVRASLHSRAGRDLRQHLNAERQKAFLAAVREARPTLGKGELHRRAAVAQLIDSAAAWESMRDYWGLDGKQAAQAAAEALEILLGRRSAQPEDNKREVV